ncbi:MAG: methyltransferase domain-containing protein [Betaproteobacteria bacterium]|nr:methyltransferase domain-containing protein [Betaproteobacteria bacterium]
MLEHESGAMRLCRAIGMEGLAWSLRRLHCPVARSALVLEVGSGGNPYPRANVLLDAYENTRERHWVPLKTDRPTVLGFAENLPFRDQAFDFVIASHVLEHSAHPQSFLAELQRVAAAGYIEVPHALMERMNPYRDHRLEIACREGRLIIRKKPRWVVDETLLELYEERAKALIAGKLIPAHPFAFHVRYYWEGKIEFTVLNPEQDAGWTPARETPADGARQGASFGIKQRLLDLLRPWLSQRSRNRNVDLLSLMRCSACHGPALRRAQTGLQCADCDARYPVRNGIPVMNPEILPLATEPTER